MELVTDSFVGGGTISYYKKLDAAAIRNKLGHWYDKNHRDLPWRRTRDPYAIWISEIMLQQTRVAAVIPYFERFLARFPTVEALAGAPEKEVLLLWSGLGYYSRARNLKKAARAIVAAGAFPQDYDSIRELAGVGDYTAAAVASIAFGLPHAAIDGNVRRVIARLTNDVLVNVGDVAGRLLDRRDPGRSNQALMELGAVVCLPRDPRCAECPLERHCQARKHGTAANLPARRAKPAPARKERRLLVIRKNGKILLAPGERVKGFWDLPEPFQGVRLGDKLGAFRHSITNSQYCCEVYGASARRAPPNMRWWDDRKLSEIPLSTASKKALRCFQDADRNKRGEP
jgi:A/G-specific adenine glycosylase